MSREHGLRWYIGALLLTDAVVLAVALVLATVARGPSNLPRSLTALAVTEFSGMGVAAVSAILGVLWLRHAYARLCLLGGPDEYVRAVSGCTYGIVAVAALNYVLDPSTTMPLGWFVVFWALAVAFICAGRFMLRRLAYRMRRRGWFMRRVLIAGASDQGLTIAQQLHGPTSHGIRVVGFLDDYLPPGTHVAAAPSETRTFRVLGHPRNVRELARQYACDLLVVVPTALSWESQQHLTLPAATADDRLEVRLAHTAYDFTAMGVEPAPLCYVPLLRLQPARIVGLDAAMRATVDAILAGSLLVLAAPLLLWLVLAARLRGIRPMFVTRHVVGQGRHPVPVHLLNRRVTNNLVARGLPALLAVLQGELALVGPRPVLLEQAAAYQHWIGLLTSVKPGLTGPWRLVAAPASLEEVILADAWWVRNWTIWQHLFVLFQTARRAWRPARSTLDLGRWEIVAQSTPEQPSPANGMLAATR